MIRVAQYLLLWTGHARFADYIERSVYNGVIAQQNPNTGMVAYFLPLQLGAKKIWGSETHDFWCCHGTSVQAQAMFETLIYYRSPEGISVMQFIPSEVTLGEKGRKIRIALKNDERAAVAHFSNVGDTTVAAYTLKIAEES